MRIKKYVTLKVHLKANRSQCNHCKDQYNDRNVQDNLQNVRNVEGRSPEEDLQTHAGCLIPPLNQKTSINLKNAKNQWIPTVYLKKKPANEAIFWLEQSAPVSAPHNI